MGSALDEAHDGFAGSHLTLVRDPRTLRRTYILQAVSTPLRTHANQSGSYTPRDPHLTIARWIKEYSPLITILSRLDNTVIIGRYKAVVDIMEDQGKSIADRPRMVAAGECGGLSLGFQPFGETARRMRRAIHAHLQPQAAEAYQSLQMSHVKNTILDILDDPYNFRDHVKTLEAIFGAVLGKRQSFVPKHFGSH
ncbi:hypothetical protein DFH29DRAFT_1006896 [Suillus ampliporus]|nr:hypothetical protein DFH29DRAFT_1006896 [Suillus ampliporus]